MPSPADHSRVVTVNETDRCLDAVQLEKLEQSFRSWGKAPKRADHKHSRSRIVLIFLMIRYSGARLSEVLNLNPLKDIDFSRHTVRFLKNASGKQMLSREVQIPEFLSLEIRKILDGTGTAANRDSLFRIDPGHVRRKFYERAQSCGIDKEMGAPDVIRKSRAVELMQNNVPLPVVQKILGHSTPNLTASYVAFSDADIKRVAEFYIEKESKRKTSARNSFFGKIQNIRKGEIQALVAVATVDGNFISAMITIDSLVRLGLKTGALITAEVKAPWVSLSRTDPGPDCSAENRFRGTVKRITSGPVITEFVLQISDGLDLCAIVTTESSQKLDLKVGQTAWAVFNSFSVVLHSE